MWCDADGDRDALRLVLFKKLNVPYGPQTIGMLIGRRGHRSDKGSNVRELVSDPRARLPTAAVAIAQRKGGRLTDKNVWFIHTVYP